MRRQFATAVFAGAVISVCFAGVRAQSGKATPTPGTATPPIPSPTQPIPSPTPKTSEPRSIWDGVYTEEQAKRGEPLYRHDCSSCHGEKLEGVEESPSLAGADFISDWKDDTLDKLFNKIRLTMPKGEPGQVELAAKADILAYILSVNKFPPGSNELSPKPEDLKGIRLEAAKP